MYTGTNTEWQKMKLSDWKKYFISTGSEISLKYNLDLYESEGLKNEEFCDRQVYGLKCMCPKLFDPIIIVGGVARWGLNSSSNDGST